MLLDIFDKSSKGWQECAQVKGKPLKSILFHFVSLDVETACLRLGSVSRHTLVSVPFSCECEHFLCICVCGEMASRYGGMCTI